MRVPPINPGTAGRGVWLHAATWLLVLVLLGNAAVHVAAVCRPLISSDNWWLLDPFLRKAADGELAFGDFLVKRVGVDHAQPLGKLVVWLNYRLWDLDFVYEGLLALGFALAGLVVLYRFMLADAQAPRPPAVHALFAAIAGVFLSLNTSMIYVYSMVTLWFSLYMFSFMAMYAAWHAMARGGPWPLAAVMLAYGIVGDDSAIMLGLALAIVLLLHGWRCGTLRRAWAAIAVMAGALAVCRGIYLAFGTFAWATDPEFSAPLGERVSALWALRGEAWNWWAIPTSSGIAGIGALKRLFGEDWQAVRTLLAVLLLAAHAWFWWKALRLRPRAAWFAAVALMLLYYAHVAGLLLARVFLRGTAYLEQPRYVSFYQLGIMALLLMAIAAVLAAREGAVRRRWPPALATAVAVALLAWQLPLSHIAAGRVPSLVQSNERQAAAIAEVARDPVNPPASCSLMVCRMPEENRVGWARLLVDEQLSLFSPRFQARHPNLAEAAGLRDSGSSAPSRLPASPR